jgi:hypothetical protein
MLEEFGESVAVQKANTNSVDHTERPDFSPGWVTSVSVKVCVLVAR